MQPEISLDICLQIYVFVTADFETKRNHLNRVTLYDKIIQKQEDAVIEEPFARIAWPFAFTDQGFRPTGFHRSLAVKAGANEEAHSE